MLGECIVGSTGMCARQAVENKGMQTEHRPNLKYKRRDT